MNRLMSAELAPANLHRFGTGPRSFPRINLSKLQRQRDGYLDPDGKENA